MSTATTTNRTANIATDNNKQPDNDGSHDLSDNINEDGCRLYEDCFRSRLLYAIYRRESVEPSRLARLKPTGFNTSSDATLALMDGYTVSTASLVTLLVSFE